MSLPSCTLTISTFIGDVEAKILVDPYRKGINEFGPWREVTYLVDWDASDFFVDALMGLGGSPAAPGSLITIPLPHAYPGNSRLLCLSAEAEGIDMGRPDAKLIAGEYAVVTARYGVPPFDIVGQDHEHAIGGEALPYTRFETRGYTESVSIPASVLETEDGDPVTRDKQIGIPAQEIIVTRFFCSYNPDNDISFRSLVGRLNSNAFLDRPTGTVIFESYDTDPQTTPDGRPVTTTRLVYRWREYDWNAQPVDDNGTLAWKILEDTTGNFPLQYANLDYSLRFGL